MCSEREEIRLVEPINLNKYYIKNSESVIYDQKSNPGHIDLIISASECSDGFHTFDELYDHRMTLFCTLLNIIERSNDFRLEVWKSELHSDGTIPFNNPNYFIAGIESDVGQITYHLRMNPYWNILSNITILGRAPHYDGHTSNDVLRRLRKI